MLSFPNRLELRGGPLQTRRLTLLPLDVADAPELWEAVDTSRQWLQPWLPWVASNKTPDASVRFAEASAKEWDVGRAARFLIREQPGGRLLGVVGLEDCVAMHRSCNLGYWLRKDATGRGLMVEAACKCIEFGFRTMGAHRIRVAAATGNHPSLRVIQRVGFQFEGIGRQAEWVDGRWLDHAVFSLLEHEWRNPQS